MCPPDDQPPDSALQTTFPITKRRGLRPGGHIGPPLPAETPSLHRDMSVFPTGGPGAPYPSMSGPIRRGRFRPAAISAVVATRESAADTSVRSEDGCRCAIASGWLTP